MRNQLFTACVLSVALVAAPVSSQAGDAYDPYDPGPRYKSGESGAYDGSGPLRYPPSGSRYSDRYDAPRRHARTYQNRRHSCLSRRNIRRKLKNAGYYDIHRRKTRASYIKFHAWHGDGRRYRILVDRCNGRVVRSRILRRGGSPRDYARPYTRPNQSTYTHPTRPYERDYRVY